MDTCLFLVPFRNMGQFAMDHFSDVPIDSLGEILENAPAFSASPGEEDSPPPLAPSPERYYRRVEGKETGPFTLAELQALIEQGELHKPDRVRGESSNFWVPCQELSDLVFRAADDAHEKEIQQASSLLNELFSDDELPAANGDLLAFEDLPDMADTDLHSPVTGSMPGDFREEPPSTSLAEWAELTAPSPRMEPFTPQPVTKEPQSRPSELKDTQFDLSTMPTHVSLPSRGHSLPVVPTASKTPEKPKRVRKRSSGRQLALPSMKLIAGLVGAILVLGAMRFWPSSPSGVHGLVAIDGTPLKVGSLSLKSAEGKNDAMSFSVVEGRFQSEKRLPDGGYEAVVIVGDPLGMEVPQLENTPFEPLNGAQFKVKVTVNSEMPELTLDLSASQAVVLKRQGGVDVLSIK